MNTETMPTVFAIVTALELVTVITVEAFSIAQEGGHRMQQWSGIQRN